MSTSANVQRALVVIGAAAAGAVALKALRTAAWWAYLRFGPVLASQYKGDFAVVTGASEGIGLGIAEALASRGVNVVLVSRSEEKLSKAVAKIRGKSPDVTVLTVAADLTAPGAAHTVSKALDEAGAKGKVSLLVCNAGGGVKRAVPYQHFTAEEDEMVRKVNGDATYSMVKELLPGMVERKKGYIVCISSLITKMPFVCLSNYYLEKAKINALATLLQAEQDAFGTGVGVQAQTLGAVVTPAFVGAVAAAAAAKSDQSEIGWEQGVIKPSLALPSAAACGEWVVRAMGKGISPVVTPYPGHALMEALSLDVVGALRWPSCLRRAVARKMHGSFAKDFEQGQ